MGARAQVRRSRATTAKRARLERKSVGVAALGAYRRNGDERRRYASRDDLDAILGEAELPESDRWNGKDLGPRTYIDTAAGGMIRVRNTDMGRLMASEDRRRERELREIEMSLALGYFSCVDCGRPRMPRKCVPEGATGWMDPRSGEIVELGLPICRGARWCDNRLMAPRAAVTFWSAKSRNRFKATMQELNWGALFTDESLPAMVTLTLPGDWLTLAPTGKDYKKLVARWQLAWRDAWGEMPMGVWKMEFQRRGAPHLHLLTAIPSGPPTGRLEAPDGSKPENFYEWLSAVWVKICDTVEVLGDVEGMKHWRAGTGVDVDVQLRYADPAAIADYFSKEATFHYKEYQNEPPAEWVEQGEVPNFWGVWGKPLKAVRAKASIEVSAEEGDHVARELRKQSKKGGATREVTVWRSREMSESTAQRLADAYNRIASDEGSATVEVATILLTGPVRAVRSLIMINSADGEVSPEILRRACAALRAAEPENWQTVEVDGELRRVNLADRWHLWQDADGVIRRHSPRKVRRRVVYMQRNRGFYLNGAQEAAAEHVVKLVLNHRASYPRPFLDEFTGPEWFTLRKEDFELADD